jgi:hypothetical protein
MCVRESVRALESLSANAAINMEDVQISEVAATQASVYLSI